MMEYALVGIECSVPGCLIYDDSAQLIKTANLILDPHKQPTIGILELQPLQDGALFQHTNSAKGDSCFAMFG